jgi:ubiquinone/menaquinone biosynthesis C-methylase UbiE
MVMVQDLENRYYDAISAKYTNILEQLDAQRKQKLFNVLVTANTQSVLDVGGANGWVTIGFPKEIWVITQDISMQSLKRGDGESILSDAANLPFPDKSFDMVICSQVLEHIPQRAYKGVISEISRIARKEIVISVPYREDLSMRNVECSACGKEFNSYYHKRAYSEIELSLLFADWVMAEWHVFGKLNTDSNMAVVDSISRKSTYRTPPLAEVGQICPLCGNQIKVNHRRKDLYFFLRLIIKKLSSNWHRLISLFQQQKFLPQAKNPYWIASVYIPAASRQEFYG